MYATTASSSTGVNNANAGSTVEIVTTEVKPAAGTPVPAGITSFKAGIARISRTNPRAGPATPVAAPSPIATLGAGSLPGGPPPARKPVGPATPQTPPIPDAAA